MSATISTPLRLGLGERGGGVSEQGKSLCRRAVPEGHSRGHDLQLGDAGLIGHQRARPLDERERGIGHSGGGRSLRGTGEPVP
jgi:hypothetical protein